MLTMINAVTHELDDAAIAVSEILQQLDLPHNQRTHSVALLTCYPEFIDTGVAKAVCDSLPFDVVGCTTLASAAGDDGGLMALSLSVLTSDDVSFSVALTEKMNKDHLEPLEEAYKKALATLSSEPVMIIPFVSVTDYMSGDLVIERLNAISGGIPLFGTLPSDHTSDYAEANVLYNGVIQQDRVIMALLAGPVSPQFYIVSIPEENRQKQKAIITSSEDNVLHQVNNMPLGDYLATIGLVEEGSLDAAKIVPFVVDYNDGTTPVARGIYRFLDNGSAMCGGLMPCGSTLSIGSLEHSDVINTANQIIKAMLLGEKPVAMLAFSCICRGWALGLDTMGEITAVQQACGSLPFHFSYSGGEICPVYNAQGEHFNRFHNYSCIVCAFRTK